MADRFDRFSDRARRVLTHAQEEAQRFNHNYIGTEHLLLGLLRESDGVAGKVLMNLDVDLPRIRSAVEFITGRGDRSISGSIGLTPRAKTVIELAVAEARRLNHSYIGTEHLLAGLVGEGEGVAFGVLQSLGVTIDSVRAETASLLRENAGESSATGSVAHARAGQVLALSPDPEARDAARDAIGAAVAAVAGFTGERFERELLDALLLPQLTALSECLSSRATSTSDVLITRRRTQEILRTVSQAATVLQRHGHAEIARALETAGAAVTRAIAS